MDGDLVEACEALSWVVKTLSIGRSSGAAGAIFLTSPFEPADVGEVER
jgi:hypothetical protein